MRIETCYDADKRLYSCQVVAIETGEVLYTTGLYSDPAAARYAAARWMRSL